MNTLSKKQFKSYIDSFDFTNLFNQLGWTFADDQFPVKLKEETYIFHSVAEKGGFRIIVFKPVKNQDLPDYNKRLQLDRKIAKLYREHLIIFCDKNNTAQIWQVFVKQLGKPSRLSETQWHKGQEPELLYQKTSKLFFTLDEEENITIADVTDRVNENFRKNVEQVTKKFYEFFRKEHQIFIAFIKGIPIPADKDWYASLMLNRLMFCYFIQKKGFLDNNPNYLKEKLEACQKKGKDKFYAGFYKNFLLALFHQGLGSPEHSEELKKELGKIPYLNGGLFNTHDLEKEYADIDIADQAFSNVFKVFDQYNWHLDTRITASGNDINPDVIGYIFEKFINDRSKMGAYYTKEDITDYISKNCIIPYLFDETGRHYPKAFKTGSEIWNMLQESGDAYIYEAVKKGVDLSLPEEIAIGLDTEKPNLLERRKEWNKPAPPEFALPTEIWREVVDRHKRYSEVKAKIEKGEIQNINAFLTYNLNIRQFAEDVITICNDPKFLEHFYKSIAGHKPRENKNEKERSPISIIDPTCGSGAFLFAALNLLEDLYDACLMRMKVFVDDEPDKYDYFKWILNQIEQHPNKKYFYYKSIILNNLYGVDIMKEAVEIAKLRLFLKLAATIEADHKKPNLGLEPLPDIDFNIRAGNTLVGFATENELEKSLIENIEGAIAKQKIDKKCDIAAKAFNRYKEMQLTYGDDFKEFKKAKEELNKSLKELNSELSQLLHKEEKSGIQYDAWMQTHQPFHWFAEFYEIVHDKGGFDVIIGNPPYVEYSKISSLYKINNYQTIECGNLHTFCMERSLQIKSELGYLGFIVPLAIISTPRMESAIKMIKKNANAYFSSFECRPAKLFEGADIRLTIAILTPMVKGKIHFFSTKLIKFSTEQRECLFERLSYSNLSKIKFGYNLIPKLSNEIEINIYNKLYSIKKTISYFISENSSSNKVYYSYGFRYWAKALDIPTYFEGENASKSTGEKELNLNSKNNISLIASAMSSSLFYWYYVATSDAHNFTKHIIYNFPIDEFHDDILSLVFSRYQKDLEKNSILKTANYKSTGTITYREYYVKKSKPIIDEIDKVLAKHYGFTEEELDFIINYDIKYRMGKELESGEE